MKFSKHFADVAKKKAGPDDRASLIDYYKKTTATKELRRWN
jgi:acetaldehyde dehydrogenase (acetylating)